MPARKIIIDTDPGVDDVLAIILALASPEVDVRLISIVFGNTHAPVAHSNLLKIYHLLANEIAAIPEAAARFGGLQNQGNGKTVLALGEDGPIGGEKAVAAYFHGKDGLSNISQTHPEFDAPKLVEGASHEHLDIDPRPAYEVMLELLRDEPEGEVVIVALGPLTNMAHAMRADPKTFARAAGIVWMGGTLDHPGNTSPTAEFNCFADPYAAAQILAAAKAGEINLMIAPLDITTPHQIPFTDLIHPSSIRASQRTKRGPEHLLDQVIDSTEQGNDIPEVVESATEESKGEVPPTPIQAFVGAMLLRVRGLQASFGLPDAMEMHDPVSVWYAIAHAHLPGLGVTPVPGNAKAATGAQGWKLLQRDFQIERTGELTRGMCVVDRRGTGESAVDRTKDEKLVENGVVPSLPSKDEETGRMGEKLDKAKSLPWILTGTPGAEVLRELLLSRVFGIKV